MVSIGSVNCEYRGTVDGDGDGVESILRRGFERLRLRLFVSLWLLKLTCKGRFPPEPSVTLTEEDGVEMGRTLAWVPVWWVEEEREPVTSATAEDAVMVDPDSPDNVAIGTFWGGRSLGRVWLSGVVRPGTERGVKGREEMDDGPSLLVLLSSDLLMRIT